MLNMVTTAKTAQLRNRFGHRPSMKRLTLCLMIALLFCQLAANNTATAETYYVDDVNGNDGNLGTKAQPWKTISYAIGNTSPVTAGDMVYVRGGSYREMVEIKKYGTSGNWITIKNYAGETVTVDGTDAVTGWTVAESNDPYLTVQGIVNPHYANIYWARVLASTFPTTLSSTMLFEDSMRCRIASAPEQSLGYGESILELRTVDSSSNGQKAYLDTTLTQDDHYWNGAIVRVLLHNANTNMAEKTVADYVKDDHKIVFDSNLSYALYYSTDRQDKYRFVNHPHILDSKGEFYVSGIENVGGIDYRRVYLWPTTVGDLTSKIRITSRNYGFYRVQAAVDCYVVLDGITVFGTKLYGIYVSGASTTQRATNFTVKNCAVTDCGSHGIYFWYVDNARAENNYVRRCESRGMMASGVDSCVFKNNNSGYNTYSAMDFYDATNSMMINNTTYTLRGAHGNGTTVYGVTGMCENILIAGNKYYYTNAAFNNVRNLCVFSNLFLGNSLGFPDNVTTNAMTPWSSDYDGYMVWMNNTAPVASSVALALEYGTSGVPHHYVVNNVLYAMTKQWSENWDSTPTGAVMEDRTYNAYTFYQWQQATSCGWSLKQGEQDLRTIPFSSIFVNETYPTGDCNLKAGSPLIHAGKNVQSILSSLGITAKFAEYNFTKDLAGNLWNNNPSIGCYEYMGTPTPKPPNADAGQDQTVTALNQISAQITLDGSGSSDPDGSIVSYVWTEIINGIEVELGRGVSPTVSLPVGRHTITLKVTDNSGLTDTDTVVITVEEEEGLVGHWKFNDGSGLYAIDSSGYNITGRLMNGPSWTTQGELSFDGNDDAVEINTVNMNVNSGTIALWVKPTGFSENKRHYLFGQGTQATNNMIQLFCNDSGTLGVGLGNNASTNTNICTLNTQEWYHIALTWSGTAYAVFVDGNKTSGTFSGISTNPPYAYIGNNSQLSEAFYGLIDEVRLYNRALSVNEIANHALVFLPIGDKIVAKGETLTFTVKTKFGTIVDINDNNLLHGLSFTSNIFTWTPGYDDAGTYEVEFTAPHGSGEDFERINIVVADTLQDDSVGHMWDNGVGDAYYQLDGTVQIWDLSGSYSCTAGEWQLNYVLKQDASGKITGTGTAVNSTVNSGAAMPFTLKGGINAAGLVKLTLKGAALKGQIKATVNAGSKVLSGTVKIGKQSASFTAALAASMDGSAILELHCTAAGKSTPGTGKVTLSNGESYEFSVKGKYNTKSDVSDLTLKGSAKGTSLKLKVGGDGTIKPLKGKMLGQTLNATNIAPRLPSAEQ
jgi:hypothetical protein